MPSKRGGESLVRKEASAEGKKPERKFQSGSDAIVHFSVVDIAAERIKNGIEEEMFPPNAKISEIELSKKMGISRTTTRKALLLLEELGMLLHVPGYGMVVLGASADAQEQASEKFSALCFTAAHLAKGKTSLQGKERILQLHRALCALWEAKGQDTKDAHVFLLDREFHTQVAEAGGNAALKEGVLQLLGSWEEAPEPLCGMSVDAHRKMHEEMLDILGIRKDQEGPNAQKP